MTDVLSFGDLISSRSDIPGSLQFRYLPAQDAPVSSGGHMSREYRQSVYAPPPGATDLLLVRHGESEPARPGESFAMTQGHGDPALHPDGERQARAVAERLRHDPIAAIYVTILRRTHQTAAPLAEALGLTPIVEPDLREVHLGDWDGGLYRIKAAEGDPAFVRAKQRQEWGEIPGAET
ncbi:histidine phosphatase family protein, partial [Cribrihabitans sp. XS_ASV171]